MTEVVGDGFSDPHNFAPGGLAVIGDWLYASISNLNSTQVWRSNSGNLDSWSLVFEYDQGSLGLKDRTGLIVYKNQLYLTAENDWLGVSVWRTTDCLTWQQIGFGGLGDSNNVWTEWGSSQAVFDGRLFIGFMNYANGAEVWVYAPEISWLPLMYK